MGNLVSSPTGDLNNNELSKQIAYWANNYYNEGNKLELFNKLLRKRACCTGQKEVSIPLLAWNEGLTQWDYSSIKIPVFNSQSDITEENCKFERTVANNNTSNALYYFSKDSTNFVLSREKCSTLYTPFCNQVYNENRYSYGNQKGYYGIYFDDVNSDNTSGINLQNAYIDCNCENSILKKDAIKLMEKSESGTVTNVIDSTVAAQNLDNRCGAYFDKTYKTINARKEMLCVNSVTIAGDVDISDAAAFQTDQKCAQAKNSLSPEELQAAMIKALNDFTLQKNQGPPLYPIMTTPQESSSSQSPKPPTLASRLVNKEQNKTDDTNVVSTSVNVISRKNPNVDNNKNNKNTIGLIVGIIVAIIVIIIIIIIISLRRRSSTNIASLPALAPAAAPAPAPAAASNI